MDSAASILEKGGDDWALAELLPFAKPEFRWNLLFLWTSQQGEEWVPSSVIPALRDKHALSISDSWPVAL